MQKKVAIIRKPPHMKKRNIQKYFSVSHPFILDDRLVLPPTVSTECNAPPHPVYPDNSLPGRAVVLLVKK